MLLLQEKSRNIGSGMQMRFCVLQQPQTARVTLVQFQPSESR